MHSQIKKTTRKIRIGASEIESLKKEFLKFCIDKAPTYKIGKNHSTFVFWYQGINNKTPNTILLCIKRIKKFCQNVVILDKDNFQNYVDIPTHILNKFYRGKISITHFSDILRVWILEKYGGLWVDPTMFIYDNLPDFSDLYFYTLKSKNHFWVPGFMATGLGNQLFVNLKRMFNSYWKKYDNLVDYFIFDYFISFNYSNCAKIRKTFVDIKPSNENIFRVYKLYFKFYNKKKYENLIKNGYLYNVSHKHQKILNLIPFTLYKHILKRDKEYEKR